MFKRHRLKELIKKAFLPRYYDTAGQNISDADFLNVSISFFHIFPFVHIKPGRYVDTMEMRYR